MNEKKDVSKNQLQLKMTTKVTHFVEYDDFDRFVTQIYNFSDYEFVTYAEANNDSSYTFEPTGKIEDYNEKEADKIRSGKIRIFQNHLLFDCLVADGYLDPGTYVINVCW